MKNYVAVPLALAALSSAAQAGGLDRTGQSIDILFEKGNYAEFSIGRADPNLNGRDVAAFNPARTPSGNVAQAFNQAGAGFKLDINDRLSFAMIYDQPWGSDISYPAANANPLTPGSALLGGTQAFAESDAITGLLRYKFNDRFSIHGGLRWQQVEGNITLNGAAYGGAPPAGLSGYSVRIERDRALGWVAGAAYEIPDIALRVALTYNSEIEHEFRTTENLNPAITTTTTTKTPQSVNLDFQTGIAPNTLLMGGIRWADHSETKLRPTLAGVDLIDLEDSTTFSLGVARRFNKNWSGSILLEYEEASDDNLVSPLAPTNGFESIAIGLQYTQDKFKVSGGIRYTKLGDAFAETGTPDVARASFTGSDAVSFGIKVGYYF
ncbi:OmpP1/FadL family transporter [Phaeobacter sp. 11ANDIMAR09]|uniref:OmpP1/FadL family transporter n=1 Tax=Phaeobacter sp. 11ANDIMAR09 TaxID=1225647 RepID=UPI0006C861F2|nr:outer membrane protein transport protein [Phaeobacter sp. 11ANDIMAR09]KPD12024.1 aromatic hydrocarbon degradation protein [Phaeobacter sp. 11ANDIMAR09]